MPRLVLMNDTPIPAAGTYTTTPVEGLGDVEDMLIQFHFDYGSGGTTVKAYVQTSLDLGETWIDVACAAFTTVDAKKLFTVNVAAALTAATVPTDGTLTDDTAKDGIIGDAVRVKYVVAGTYAASTMSVHIETR